MKQTTKVGILLCLLAVAGIAGAQEVFRQTGSLDEGDRTLPDGRYVDWHRFSVAAGTRYLFTVEGDDLDPVVIVKFADGVTLENDDLNGWDAGVVFNSTRAETVEIGATSTSAENWGAYRVLVRRIAAPKAVQGGQTVTGTLAAVSGESIHLDSYVLGGVKGDRIRVRLDSDDFDPRLLLQTRGGYHEELDDSGEGTGASISYLFLDQSQLEIQVRGGGVSDTGAYTLQVERRPAARVLETGRTLTGRLSNDTEEFLFDGKRGQAYVFEATSDFDTVLTVTDKMGRKASNDDHGEGTDSLINYFFPADGTVMVSVARLESGESAPFRVSAAASSERADAFVRPAATIEDGETVRGYLDVAAERDGSKYGHTFTFRMEENELVRLEMSSVDFDSYIEVTGPDGAEYSDDDSGGDYNAQLDVVGTVAGEYVARATSAGDWSVGFYDFGFERRGEVSPTLDREGVLEYRDERDPSGRYFDVHTMEVEEGSSFTVDMSSDELDAYLYVWAPGGEEIQSDDDGGGDTSARVQVDDAIGGTWTIYATTSSGAETGTYQLRASVY